MIARLVGWVLPYAWPLAAAAGVAMLGAIGVLKFQLAHSERETAEVQAAWAGDRAQAAERARSAEAEARAEEARRTAATEKAIHDAEQKAAQARADLAIADAAAGRLRERVAALVASAREAASNPQAADPGATAGDATMVLADVFGRCITRVRELATLADQRGTAGSTCEAIHDELTP